MFKNKSFFCNRSVVCSLNNFHKEYLIIIFIIKNSQVTLFKKAFNVLKLNKI